MSEHRRARPYWANPRSSTEIWSDIASSRDRLELRRSADKQQRSPENTHRARSRGPPPRRHYAVYDDLPLPEGLLLSDRLARRDRVLCFSGEQHCIPPDSCPSSTAEPTDNTDRPSPSHAPCTDAQSHPVSTEKARAYQQRLEELFQGTVPPPPSQVHRFTTADIPGATEPYLQTEVVAQSLFPKEEPHEEAEGAAQPLGPKEVPQAREEVEPQDHFPIVDPSEEDEVASQSLFPKEEPKEEAESEPQSLCLHKRSRSEASSDPFPLDGRSKTHLSVSEWLEAQVRPWQSHISHGTPPSQVPSPADAPNDSPDESPTSTPRSCPPCPPPPPPSPCGAASPEGGFHVSRKAPPGPHAPADPPQSHKRTYAALCSPILGSFTTPALHPTPKAGRFPTLIEVLVESALQAALDKACVRELVEAAFQAALDTALVRDIVTNIFTRVRMEATLDELRAALPHLSCRKDVDCTLPPEIIVTCAPDPDLRPRPPPPPPPPQPPPSSQPHPPPSRPPKPAACAPSSRPPQPRISTPPLPQLDTAAATAAAADALSLAGIAPRQPPCAPQATNDAASAPAPQPPPHDASAAAATPQRQPRFEVEDWFAALIQTTPTPTPDPRTSPPSSSPQPSKAHRATDPRRRRRSPRLSAQTAPSDPRQPPHPAAAPSDPRAVRSRGGAATSPPVETQSPDPDGFKRPPRKLTQKAPRAKKKPTQSPAPHVQGGSFAPLTPPDPDASPPLPPAADSHPSPPQTQPPAPTARQNSAPRRRPSRQRRRNPSQRRQRGPPKPPSPSPSR